MSEAQDSFEEQSQERRAELEANALLNEQAEDGKAVLLGKSSELADSSFCFHISKFMEINPGMEAGKMRELMPSKPAPGKDLQAPCLQNKAG